ncbi:MAG: hypothetical protein QM680_02520 [Luteolibacter sp.]
MKTIKILVISLMTTASSIFAGSITGTIQQIVDGQTQAAQGDVSVGVVDADQGLKLDVLKSLGDACVEKRVAKIGIDGGISMASMPEGVPLYVSVFLNSGYGKFLQVTLNPGQTLDISQVIPDAKVGGITFRGKIVWPAGITFQEKTSRVVYLSGKNNNWEYTALAGDGEMLEVENVQPGIYRLGIHSTLANGDDRYDEAEVTVAIGMADPLLINIP